MRIELSGSAKYIAGLWLTVSDNGRHYGYLVAPSGIYEIATAIVWVDSSVRHCSCNLENFDVKLSLSTRKSC